MTDEEKALARMSQNPNARRLRAYWTTGVGGKTKIRWKTPGDFTRCVRNLRKYLAGQPESANEVCANYHKLMTGVWPGDKRNIGKKSSIELEETLIYASTLLQWSVTDLIKLSEIDPETKDN